MDHLVLNFNSAGELNDYTHSMVGLGDDYKADTTVWPALTAAYDEAIVALDKVVGYTHIDIDGKEGTLKRTFDLYVHVHSCLLDMRVGTF